MGHYMFINNDKPVDKYISNYQFIPNNIYSGLVGV